MADEDGNVCNFLKKPSRNKNIRKRTATEFTEDDDDTNILSQRPKKSLTSAKALHFSSSTPSSNPSGADDADVEAKNQGDLFHFKSTKEIQVQTDNRATASLETETEFDRDARAIRERVLKRAEESLKGKSSSEPGKKRRCTGNTRLLTTKPVFAASRLLQVRRLAVRMAHSERRHTFGLLQGSITSRTYVRTTRRRVTVALEMHASLCMIVGLQVWLAAEKEWKKREGKEERIGYGMPFEDAVVTKCKHYFCEHCALKHHSKNKKCFVCNAPTLGIFNTAHEIRKRWHKRRILIRFFSAKEKEEFCSERSHTDLIDYDEQRPWMQRFLLLL
ncbi:hypothetical protein HPP92_024413 [Vanilla planifolia]|uniref:Uncharacterized protein n=1 Tax=Vanilla planifolia TaxID=51239 RepID=A0A835UCY5_VANPL|nr:hypothetical protein HPP92_024413 [Vanilla planifolia]